MVPEAVSIYSHTEYQPLWAHCIVLPITEWILQGCCISAVINQDTAEYCRGAKTNYKMVAAKKPGAVLFLGTEQERLYTKQRSALIWQQGLMFAPVFVLILVFLLLSFFPCTTAPAFVVNPQIKRIHIAHCIHTIGSKSSRSLSLWHTHTQTHCTSIGSVQLFNMRQLPLHHLASPISARSKSNKRQSFQVTLHCTFVSSTSVHTYRTPLSPPS